MRRCFFGPLVLPIFGLCSCSDLLDLPDNPQLVAEGPWRCLGNVPEPTPPSISSAIVQVQACDFISNCVLNVTQLTANVCSKRDIGCTNPIVANISDVDGLFVFNVPIQPGGFDGYLEVIASNALCTDASTFGSAGPALCGLASDCDPQNPDDSCMIPVYARSMLFFNPPVVADFLEPVPLPLLSTTGLPSVVNAAGAELEPTAGNLFITAVDCDGRPAPGVTYSIEQHQDAVTQLYVDSGVVSDSVLKTDISGIGGFVGVPPGFAEVVGYAPDLTRIGEIGVQSAPFSMTYSALVPSR